MASNPPPQGWIIPILSAISFIETLFPPFPGDLLFIAAGGWAITGGNSVVIVIISGFAGCFAASFILYSLGRNFGRKALYGGLKYFGREKEIDRADRLFSRWGMHILLASRFIPGIRSLLVILAGSSELNRLKTLISVSLSSICWYILLGFLGQIAGNNLETGQKFLRSYEIWVWAVLGAGLIVYFLLALVRRERNRI